MGLTTYALQCKDCTIQDLVIAGFDAGEAFGAGYDEDKLSAVNIALGDLKAEDEDVDDLKERGYNAEEFKEAGYTARELRNDFTAAELKDLATQCAIFWLLGFF